MLRARLARFLARLVRLVSAFCVVPRAAEGSRHLKSLKDPKKAGKVGQQARIQETDREFEAALHAQKLNKFKIKELLECFCQSVMVTVCPRCA